MCACMQAKKMNSVWDFVLIEEKIVWGGRKRGLTGESNHVLEGETKVLEVGY